MGRAFARLSGRSLAIVVLAVLTALVSLAGAARADPGSGPALAATGRAAAHTPYAQLTSVSCPGARDCVAVGFHTIGSGAAVYPLAEAWNGRFWRRLKTPAIQGTLLGISCPRWAACVAVGSHDAGEGNQAAPLAATWNGRRWRLRATANLDGHPGVTDLAGISCTSPRRCTATSGYGDAEPTVTAAVEAWNGTKWRLRAVFDQSSLNGVACKTSTSCLAVGSTSPASDSWVPFAAARTASAWQPAATPPGDSGDLDTSMSSVSCAATALCMAVGEGSLIDEWAGAAWKQMTVPGVGQLDGVSCKNPATCVAVGQDGHLQAAAQAWNGTAWRALAPVHPRGPSELARVSCSAPARCMAVGFYGTPYVRHAMAERWNGAEWLWLKTPAA
jgi:hypothetical protein